MIRKQKITLLFVIFSGRGKSKKEAKRLAAHQMWQRLQDMPADNQDDVADEVSSHFRAVNDVKCPRYIRPLHKLTFSSII